MTLTIDIISISNVVHQLLPKKTTVLAFHNKKYFTSCAILTASVIKVDMPCACKRDCPIKLFYNKNLNTLNNSSRLTVA